MTFVLKRTIISCFSFEYINAFVMFHAVKNDPITFSVLSRFILELGLDLQ